MREVMFRGKRVDNGEWVYGSYVGVETRIAKENVCVIFGHYSDENSHEILPHTLGQYTGLTDKNGQRIFEGDILKSHSDWINLKTIEWHWNGWCLMQDGCTPDPVVEDGCLPYSVVVGNIHDTPELLKGGAPNEAI